MSDNLAKLRARKKRLTPIQDIKWLTDAQRLKFRQDLKFLSDSIVALDDNRMLSPEAQKYFYTITGTDDIEVWLLNAEESYVRMEKEYEESLVPMAQHSLGAYHEFMNFEEFPQIHHDLLINDLESCLAGKISTLAFSLPPGVAKSTYGSKSFVQWAMGRNPDYIFLSCGNTQRFTETTFSKPNRNTINTDRYRRVFPDIFLKEDSTAVDLWELDGFKGKYYAKSVGGSIAGIRANITVLDDPIGNAQIANSATERENHKRWLFADVLSRRLPNNRLIMIATRWHSEDLIGCVKAAYEKNPEAVMGPVKVVNIPAQYNGGDVDPLGRSLGEYIWRFNKDGSEHYSNEHYESLKLTMPASEWSALYQGIPLDKSGDYVSENDFARYDDVPVNPKEDGVTDKARLIRRTFVSIDTAQKGKEKSNFTAMTVWRQTQDGRLYLLEPARTKLKMDDIIKETNRLAEAWKCDFILLENAAMGTQIIENYSGKMYCPIVEYNPASKGSKEFAFEAAVPYVKSGRVLFPRRAPMLVDYFSELIAFPSGQYDDWVDSTSQAVLYSLKARGKFGTIVLKSSR
jgi:predicted phage terminase large subunit-like protein